MSVLQKIAVAGLLIVFRVYYNESNAVRHTVPYLMSFLYWNLWQSYVHPQYIKIFTIFMQKIKLFIWSTSCAVCIVYILLAAFYYYSILINWCSVFFLIAHPIWCYRGMLSTYGKNMYFIHKIAVIWFKNIFKNDKQYITRK